MKVGIWLFFVLGIYTQASTDYASEVAKFCEGTNISALLPTSRSQRLEDLINNMNQFGIPLDKILTLYQKFSVSEVIGPSAFAIVASVGMIVIALISIILYFFFLCCCDSCCCKFKMAVWVMFALTAISFLVIAGVGVYLFILSTNTVKSMSDVICTVSLIPNNIINGVTTNGMNFLGLQKISRSLGALSSEADNLNAVALQAAGVIATDLQTQGGQTKSSLKTYYDLYSPQTVVDGEGNQNTPKAISSLNVNITDAMGVEFFDMGNLATSVGKSVQVVGDIILAGTSSFKDQLKPTVSIIDDFIKDIESTFSTIRTLMDVFTAVGKQGSIFIMIAIGVTIAFTVALFAFLFFLVFQNKFGSKRWIAKLILIFSGIISFASCILTLILFVNAFASGTICSSISVILNLTSFQQYLSSFGISIGSVSSVTGQNNVISIVDACISLGGSGDPTNIFQDSSSATNYYTLLGDLTDGFRNYTANLTKFSMVPPVPIESVEGARVKSDLNLYYTGQKVNFNNVDTAITNLNTQVACGSSTYGVSLTSCTGTCILITEASTFSPPACLTDSTVASGLYSKIQSYLQSSNPKMQSMMDDLDTNASSPNQLFRSTTGTLTAQSTSIVSLFGAMANTFAPLLPFSGSFKHITNCQSFRTQLEIMQGAYCLSMNKNNGMLFTMAAVVSAMLLLFNCMGYFTLKCVERDVPRESSYERPFGQNVVYPSSSEKATLRMN